MQITFLGTSSGVPTRSRNVSSVALRLPQRGEVWLFDCGEGTQHQFLRSEFKSSQIRRIFITHMHCDHIFGLMGLLASCGLAGNRQQCIDIYGPKPLGDYLQACRRYSHTHFTLPIQVHGVEPGVVFEDREYRVLCDRLEHRIPAYGYRVEERDRPGHFDVKRAEALGIPPGPIYGQLKHGLQVTLPNGRKVKGTDLCGPDLVGRKLVYCTDTIYCDRSVALAHQADVLIHEATFAHQDAGLAYERLHSTSTMAAQVALGAQVRQLIMTHFSPRYAPGNNVQLSDLLTEAQAIFPSTTMAYDFMIYNILRQEEKTALSSAS
ncbi:MAG: ribonuclease Z [Nodosilinea sp.]